MTRIDTFSGTADELSQFVGKVWSDSYTGKMSFIHWTPEYLQWQLRLDDPQQRNNLLAAYDGNTLVGVLLGINHSFRVESEVIPGSLWSWLSVRSDYRGRDIVKALDEERQRRQREAGSKLIASFRYFGTRHSLAERPVNRTPQQYSSRLGFWARVLNPARFGRWHVKRLEANLGALSGPFAPVPRLEHKGTTICRFRHEDLDECLELVRNSYSTVKFSVDWAKPSLAHQLAGNSLSHTLLLKEGGRICGLINFHVLPFQSRTIEKVGVIDLLAFGGGSSRKQAQLVDAALAEMRALDAILALKLRSGDAPAVPLLRNCFVPQHADSFVVLRWLDRTRELPENIPMHLLWR